MVIQVSYIVLTQGQEYSFQGMKFNMLKNNMHCGVFQEKNICNSPISSPLPLEKALLCMKVLRRLILENSPKNAVNSRGEGMK